MESLTKKLRAYQVRLVTDVCRTTEDVSVEQPTGSGKTVQIVTLVAMHLGQRFTHAVISAPQEQIEQGFVKRDYQVIAFPDHAGVAQPALAAGERLIRPARRSGLGSVKQISAHLRQRGPVDYAIACTHAALYQLTPDKLPADLCGRALFIDEAHHASADGLAQIVSLWRERGGQLFFFTATPYRGDGRPVKLEGMRSSAAPWPNTWRKALPPGTWKARSSPSANRATPSPPPNSPAKRPRPAPISMAWSLPSAVAGWRTANRKPSSACRRCRGARAASWFAG